MRTAIEQHPWHITEPHAVDVCIGHRVRHPGINMRGGKHRQVRRVVKPQLWSEQSGLARERGHKHKIDIPSPAGHVFQIQTKNLSEIAVALTALIHAEQRRYWW